MTTGPQCEGAGNLIITNWSSRGLMRVRLLFFTGFYLLIFIGKSIMDQQSGRLGKKSVLFEESSEDKDSVVCIYSGIGHFLFILLLLDT